MSPSSVLDPSLPPLVPIFPQPSSTTAEPASLATLITKLNLRRHVEGGYFTEFDRSPLRIPNPFLSEKAHASSALQEALDASSSAAGTLAAQGYNADASGATRSASTSILYLLTPATSQGGFHRNRGRTVHTLIKGRGRYVIIHADEVMAGEAVRGQARVEVFTVGMDVANGERVQWVVEGGKYKASYLLDGEGLLIAETVVPGFEFEDHDFLTEERATELLGKERLGEVSWLLRQGE